MKIVCISDTHCRLRHIAVDLHEGDFLIHAGDALSQGTLSEWGRFIKEFAALPHKHKIYVPGNHDRITELNEDLVKKDCAKAGVIYLNNTGIEIEGKYFYGSAITPRFHNWAWNRDSGNCGTSYESDHPDYEDIAPYWDAIPEKTDILITHGPPQGIMDISIYDKVECGCPILRHRVHEVEPTYHIFGHIHNWHGIEVVGSTTFINASSCDEKYRAVNTPITVELK